MYKEKAVDYFDRHKESQECHITSDGRVFHTSGSAQGFAHGLKDKKITTYKRSDLEVKNIVVTDATLESGAEGTGEGTGADGGDTSGANGGDTGKSDVDPNIEALKAFDSATAKYDDAKAAFEVTFIN